METLCHLVRTLVQELGHAAETSIPHQWRQYSCCQFSLLRKKYSSMTAYCSCDTKGRDPHKYPITPHQNRLTFLLQTEQLHCPEQNGHFQLVPTFPLCMPYLFSKHFSHLEACDRRKSDKHAFKKLPFELDRSNKHKLQNDRRDFKCGVVEMVIWYDWLCYAHRT